jgi:hypothetical protein
LEGKIIQLVVKKMYENTESILKDFDFNITKCYLTESKVYISPEMMNDVMKKEITINKITKPLDSLKRLSKYHNKQFAVSEPYKYLISLLSVHDMNIILSGAFYELV